MSAGWWWEYIDLHKIIYYNHKVYYITIFKTLCWICLKEGFIKCFYVKICKFYQTHSITVKLLYTCTTVSSVPSRSLSSPPYRCPRCMWWSEHAPSWRAPAQLYTTTRKLIRRSAMIKILLFRQVVIECRDWNISDFHIKKI